MRATCKRNRKSYKPPAGDDVSADTPQAGSTRHQESASVAQEGRFHRPPCVDSLWVCVKGSEASTSRNPSTTSLILFDGKRLVLSVRKLLYRVITCETLMTDLPFKPLLLGRYTFPGGAANRVFEVIAAGVVVSFFPAFCEVARYNGPAIGSDSANAIATDASGTNSRLRRHYCGATMSQVGNVLSASRLERASDSG
jgi:hypothetical protein